MVKNAMSAWLLPALFFLECPLGCAPGKIAGDCESNCSRAGLSACVDGRIRGCLPDATGCLTWGSWTACETGTCTDAFSCSGCSNGCALSGNTRCENGNLSRCAADARGCLAWGAPSRCETESCLDNLTCRASQNPTGKTYVVTKDGTGDFTTIQEALNVALAGDTVEVKNGTYGERVSIENSGAAGKWITLQNFPGHAPVIDGSGVAGSGALIDVDNKQYLKISGFTITNNANGAFNYGIAVEGTSATVACHHIIVEKNTISKTGGSGIFFQYGTFRTAYVEDDEDYVIQDNDLSDTNIYRDENGVAWQEALEVNRLNNFVIRNNTVRQSYKEGISAGSSRFGRIYGNTVFGPASTPSTAGTTCGIYVGGSGTWQDLTNADIEVFNNLIHGRLLGIAVASENGQTIGNVKVYNNIVYDTSIGFRLVSFTSEKGVKKDISFFNNVAYANGSGIMINSQPMSGILVRNNIAIQNESGSQISISGSGVTSDHNIVSGDPFVNAAGHDFHLPPGSPAIDAGSSEGAPTFDFDNRPRPQGTSIDIGAFER